MAYFLRYRWPTLLVLVGPGFLKKQTVFCPGKDTLLTDVFSKPQRNKKVVLSGHNEIGLS